MCYDEGSSDLERDPDPSEGALASADPAVDVLLEHAMHSSSADAGEHEAIGDLAARDSEREREDEGRSVGEAVVDPAEERHVVEHAAVHRDVSRCACAGVESRQRRFGRSQGPREEKAHEGWMSYSGRW